MTRNCVLVSANARTSGANYGGTETLLRRRYIIPSNVLLGSISAAFTDSDVLIIRVSATLTVFECKRVVSRKVFLNGEQLAIDHK